MGEGPVHPVEVLTHVLDEEDRAGEIGEPRRADQTLKQGEIAPCQWTLGGSTAQRDDTVLLGNQDARRSRKSAQAASWLAPGEDPLEVLAAECRHAGPSYRSVKGDHAGGAAYRIEK